ncbi:hypothetical protein C5167_006414 [Papaver somniferum]|uniref:Trichome birefringence-like N-terminal domain-containing protein n=1 Tax=Papaver somniferum TaxID=3469 RepID=A0A4Y7JDD1_PAPSO|nr:hypothetical protein C5167_006414 [Papaver somniferum]
MLCFETRQLSSMNSRLKVWLNLFSIPSSKDFFLFFFFCNDTKLKKMSSSVFTLENFHHYIKKPKLLLWILGLTSILSILTIYSPNLLEVNVQNFFKVNPHKDLPEGNLIKPQKEENHEKKCDLFKGHWIPDLNGPLYTNTSCPTLPASKNCGKNGRSDVDYLKCRWKPNECELPRFDPNIFLPIVRGKKLAFVGDSVARNQMESLLCLLSQVGTPVDVYKDSEERFRTFYFPNYNFTLMLLVKKEINGSNSGVYDIYLDKIDNTWFQKLPGLDYIIMSDAHWFFRKCYLYENEKLIGCTYCDEQNVTNIGPALAIGRAFNTALKFISRCQDCNDGLFTLIRTFSPAHFENGSWNGGGNCNRTSPFSEEEIDYGGSEWELRSNQVQVVERMKKKEEKKGNKKRYEILDVTRAMMMRPDGHPGSHWDNQYMKGYNDCVHWCLPGPIDVWNEFVTALLQMNIENGGEKRCDLFKGRWIPDLSLSIYTNLSCPTIPDSRNCQKFGRKDVDYMNWRWKPNECELPRLNPKTFLSSFRGKKLAFIGDSIARNQMESLLCLLSQGETPKDIHKDSEDRFRTFYFPSHNFTLMVCWTKFLAFAEEKKINGSTRDGVFNIHLDRIDNNWAQTLHGLDYAVISVSHWYFRKNYLYEGGQLIGCIYCEEPNVPDLGIPFAIEKAFGLGLRYVNDCKECNKGLVTLLRTYSPSHFEHGSWNGGGKCNRTSPYTEKQVNFAGNSEWELRNIQVKVLESIKNKPEVGKRFEILDITKAMMMRPDGHPGLHWNNLYMKGHNDCTHWCLPGPIDVWNDLLISVLLKFC